MNHLLEKLGVLAFKYERIKERENFNIFSILRDFSDEVNLHSKFIAELLDKKGSHNQGAIFFEALLKELQISFDIESYSTHREHKNIDILLRNHRQAIIVENKIWAEDQDRQLERYNDVISNEGYQDIVILYLTLDGKEPDYTSLGKLKLDEDVRLISYSYDIYNWIERCIEIASRIPSLRETLIQYQKVINELTGKTMSDDQTNEIIELLSENDNIIKAQLIAENWVHIRWHTEFRFWNDLSELVSEEFEILDTQKFSSQHLDSVIHKSRNRNPWYGIMFKIGNLHNADMCLFIERGFGELYYGVTMLNKAGREISDDPKYDHFCGFLKDNADSYEREDLWLGWKYLEPNINFELFSDKNTLLLINETHRKEFLKANWKEIQNFIQICRNGLKSN